MPLAGSPSPCDKHTTDRDLHGVLCTYKRPAVALNYIRILEGQSLQPKSVVVVDNGSDPELKASVVTGPFSFEVRYIDPGHNVGPAGAFKIGLEALGANLSDDALIAHFDDDDPPVDCRTLEELVGVFDGYATARPRLGGVGLSGGTLSRFTGLIRRVPSGDTVSLVDHLHGGYLPVYLARAIRSVGGNDESYFFGFEELELGRRLTLAGWQLLTATQLMRQLESRYPKRRLRGSGESDWGRFHKERNLIRVLRRERRWQAIVMTVLTRHIGRPLSRLPSDPANSIRRIALGLRATVAGLRDEGGIDPRYRPGNQPTA